MSLDAQSFYNVLCKWYALLPVAICPASFVIDAPFGRFAPSKHGLFTFDGIKTWIVMEIVSPLTFTSAFLYSPLSQTHNPLQLLSANPSTLLALLFLTHYANRALISPLRTPSRSKSHLLVPLSGVTFNLVNGFVMGTYLSSPIAQRFLSNAFSRSSFWIGIALWAAGFIGNIAHDEILLNLRRQKPSTPSTASKKSKENKENKNSYSIPYGLLYKYISYPNYFCEWTEWLGFAIAAAPVPPSVREFTSAAPPWIFVFAEILLMLPRAYKGHQWYHKKFPDYPKERKVVVPFVF